MTSQYKKYHHIGGTLIFSKTGAHGQKFLITYNLLEKEDMVV